jgi:hypothetical protein
MIHFATLFSLLLNKNNKIELPIHKYYDDIKHQQGYSDCDVNITHKISAHLASHNGKFPTPDEWFNEFKKK